MLDFDLEAPGLDEFEWLEPPPDQPGLVEFVSEFRRARQVPELRSFVYPVGEKRFVGHGDPLRLFSGEHESEGRELPWHTGYAMRAGRRDLGYRLALAELNWNTFYKYEDGQLFLENLRAGIAREFDCGLMIVDSRTGLTDIGSICTGHLADAVVLVFQPNTAHRKGLELVTQAIRTRERQEGRPIPRLYVASKIAPSYEGEYSDDECEMARDTVRRCELTTEVEEVWPDWLDRDQEEPNADKPLLAYIPLRTRVRKSSVPDAYLVDLHTGPGFDSLDEVGRQYAFVSHWVDRSRGIATRAMSP